MCLGIPGQIVEITDPARMMARAEVSGVSREVNISCVTAQAPEALVGSWVLIHVGFAMALIDEAEAAATLEALEHLGEAQETLAQMAESEQALS